MPAGTVLWRWNRKAPPRPRSAGTQGETRSSCYTNAGKVKGGSLGSEGLQQQKGLWKDDKRFCPGKTSQVKVRIFVIMYFLVY